MTNDTKQEAKHTPEWVGPLLDEGKESGYGIYHQPDEDTHIHFADAVNEEGARIVVSGLNERDRLKALAEELAGALSLMHQRYAPFGDPEGQYYGGEQDKEAVEKTRAALDKAKKMGVVEQGPEVRWCPLHEREHFTVYKGGELWCHESNEKAGVA